MTNRFLFPNWVNKVVPLAGVAPLLVTVYAVSVGAYGTSPETTNVVFPSLAGPFQSQVARRNVEDGLPLLPHDL